jgi:phosphoribosylformimino-5-aminoimidazole carboxamide ribotide isomerase
LIIFPAVDIKDGLCVRLVQGRPENRTVYARDPVAMAVDWQRQGAQWLHVVDLDGAFSGSPVNREIIGNIAAALSIPVQLGGGIRTVETVRDYLKLGVSRVIIGTRAQADHAFVAGLLDEFGPERVVVGIDAKDGLVAVKGWEDTTETEALALGREMAEIGVLRAVYTDVSRDGLLQGPNHRAITEMAAHSGLKIIASGGVSNLEDLRQLRGTPGVEGAILGKALYEGKLTLAEALA